MEANRDEARDEQTYLNKNAVWATGRLLELLKEHHDYSVKLVKLGEPKLKIVTKPAVIPKDIEPVHLEEMPSHRGVIRAFNPGALHFPVEDIKRKVCDYFNFTAEELLSHAKPARLVYARQIALFLACRYGKHSYAETGRRFGHRDHTTVRHAYHKITRLIPSDWTIAFDVAHLETLLQVAS